MPDVTGKSLDVALSDIERAGLGDDVEVLGGGLFGVVEKSNWQVCVQTPVAGEIVTGKPRLEVDRSCDDDAADDATATPEADAYVYAGPPYEVVATEETGIGLTRHWVLTAPQDYSTAAYRDQFKLIIADVARAAGSAEIVVEVVTDPEIIDAESAATIADWMNTHDAAYIKEFLLTREASGWVASYTGGYDYDAGESSATAHEVIWFGSSTDAEIERGWKPDIAD
ncbi:hypothetical protein [Microbacterium sp.]|uniref:hypothetical protein n=1 Tax=Microbacterium sp. TaxID=51671 RepID=UPI0039E5B012